LVTGATGLIGSNIARRLVEDGDHARAVVRPGSDYQPLVDIGVEAADGDVTDLESLVRAADGCDAIIHSAAVLGGAAQQIDEQRATNVGGAGNVFDAGATIGCRVVTLSTTTFFQHDTSLTEDSPVVDDPSDDPYTVTKAAAYADAMARAADGADIVVVIPGGTFGPGVSVRRAMGPTSYNRAIRGVLNGKITDYVTYSVPWVYAEDVAAASIAAMRHGEAGHKYLAFGAEDAQSTAAFLNVACEVAGVEQRVAEVSIDADDPEARARYGPSLVALSQRRFPVPWFDNSKTRARLDYQPRPLRDAMAATVAWLRRHGQI
jgi:nucleoside-diphosphate-sugar epimerase